MVRSLSFNTELFVVLSVIQFTTPSSLNIHNICVIHIYTNITYITRTIHRSHIPYIDNTYIQTTYIHTYIHTFICTLTGIHIYKQMNEKQSNEEENTHKHRIHSPTWNALEFHTR